MGGTHVPSLINNIRIHNSENQIEQIIGRLNEFEAKLKMFEERMISIESRIAVIEKSTEKT